MGKRSKSKTDGVHGKIFINCRGETLLCRGRLMFLEAIDETGSIAEASRRMGYSYRKGWGLVEKTNRAAGREIIKKISGGSGGGGAYLTEDGKKLVRLFKEFLDENKKMTDSMWERFKREFPD